MPTPFWTIKTPQDIEKEERRKRGRLPLHCPKCSRGWRCTADALTDDPDEEVYDDIVIEQWDVDKYGRDYPVVLGHEEDEHAEYFIKVWRTKQGLTRAFECIFCGWQLVVR